jgi:GTP cyclohydrolase III
MAEVDEHVAANYLRACRAYKLAERVKDRYEIQLRAEMGRAKRATTATGRKVATRTVSEIAESTVTRAAHRRDYLTPAKEPK